MKLTFSGKGAGRGIPSLRRKCASCNNAGDKKGFIHHINLFFKGYCIGAANIIPGVSGGTIALITGIFEELINSIKSIDIQSIKLLLIGNFSEFSRKVNFYFLLTVFGGAVISIFTMARILEYLFLNFPVYVWAYFFGLIMASVYFVGKIINKWTLPVVLLFLAGTLFAAGITYLNPAAQNDNFFYLIICGMAAVCSMILPGLSGSFVLILMGNYELVAIDAVNNLRLEILIPMLFGIIAGLIMFSRFLSWLIKKFRDHTIAALSGFITGSLVILWPWKYEIYRFDGTGNPLLLKSGDLIVQTSGRFIPQVIDKEVITALILMLAGIFTIWGIEFLSRVKHQNN